METTRFGFLILISLCSIVGCDRREVYVPVLREEKGGEVQFVKHPELFTSAHSMYIQELLNEYDYRYEIDKNKNILIPRSLANDVDLLSNLTEKAVARENTDTKE